MIWVAHNTNFQPKLSFPPEEGRRVGNHWKSATTDCIYTHMAVYEIDYAKEHLTELFHQARQGFEVVITREDGKPVS